MHAQSEHRRAWYSQGGESYPAARLHLRNTWEGGIDIEFFFLPEREREIDYLQVKILTTREKQ